MAIPPNKPGPSNAHMLYVPMLVFAILCPILVGLRIWSRLRKRGKLGPDDYCIFAALAFALASSALIFSSCMYGFGQHIANLDPRNKLEALKYFYLSQITYKSSINLTKCSILLLYVRIFNHVRRFRWACWVLTACVAMYAIASVVATIFQCNPIPFAFDKSLGGTCIDNNKFWYANAGFSVATDCIILFMPMPLVYQLQIPRIQKIALVVVFALGAFVVITSCLRMTTINLAAKSPDITFDVASTMWTVIEAHIAVICACLPMIRPLIVKIFPKLMPKSSSANKRYGYGYGYGHGYGYGSSYGRNSRHASVFAGKGYGIGSQSQSPDGASGASNWSGHAETKDGINLTTISRAGRGSQGSEEHILDDVDDLPIQQPRAGSSAGSESDPADRAVKNGTGIQKTVQYSIEYS